MAVFHAGVIALPIKPCQLNGEQFFSENGANEAQLCQLSPCTPGEQDIKQRLPGGCSAPLVQLSAGSSNAWGSGEGAEK